MKNIFFAIAIFAILFISCRNNSSNQTDTHIHDDGTEHINHDNGEQKMPEQEVFEVEVDSLNIGNDSLNGEHETEHSHDSDHETEHSHDGGHDHKHK